MMEEKRLIGMGEVTREGTLSLHRFIAYAIDFAQTDMERLDVGPLALEKEGLSLVVHGWAIELSKIPVYGKWIREITDYTVRRNLIDRYHLVDCDGTCVLKARSRQIIFDKKRRAMATVPEKLVDAAGTRETMPHDLGLESVLVERDDTFLSKEYPIYAHHIDVNGHINNRVLPMIGLSTLEGAFVRKLKITYHRESAAPFVTVYYKDFGTERRFAFYDTQDRHLASMTTDVEMPLSL